MVYVAQNVRTLTKILRCTSLFMGMHLCLVAPIVGQDIPTARVHRMMQMCGVELVTDTAVISAWPEGVTGRQADQGALDLFSKLLHEELALYPLQFWEKLELRRIVLCGDLVVDGTLRGGVIIKSERTLYLEVVKWSEFPVLRRRTVHHELYHAVDLSDSYRDGQLLYGDRDWAALNSKGIVSYVGETEAVLGDSKGWCLTTGFPGFATHYATVDIAEDKADVFASLMVLPRWMDYLGSKDVVVGAKAQRIKEMLRLFCVTLDAEFWLHVAQQAGRAGVPDPGDDASRKLQERLVEKGP